MRTARMYKRKKHSGQGDDWCVMWHDEAIGRRLDLLDRSYGKDVAQFGAEVGALQGDSQGWDTVPQIRTGCLVG